MIKASYLEEALHVLQDVHTAVTEVVLLRHAWTRALHHLLAKTPLGALTHLPFHLKISAHTHTNSQLEEVL